MPATPRRPARWCRAACTSSSSSRRGTDRAMALGRSLVKLRAILALVVLAFGALAARPVAAQEDSAALQLQVEAAFLVNFLRYTQWPPDTFGNPADPYVITVVGDEDAAATLRRLTEVVTPIAGRRIAVQRLEFPPGADATVRTAISDRLRRSHLVFVHGRADPVEAILADLSGQPVLTVSDVQDFARAGGMLGLRESGGRIVFEANPEAIRNARLAVSAKVLKLARLVEGPVR